MKSVVVVGNCRSGTSLAAGILQILGVKMNADYGPPDGFAPKGYFESLGAHVINTTLFRMAWGPDQKFTYDAHLTPPAKAALDAAAEKHKHHIQAFVEKHQQEPIWGFKNPKTALTLEYFLPYLQDPHIVLTMRHPLDNARAMNHIYNQGILEAARVTCYYMENMTRVCVENRLPVVVLKFETLAAGACRAAAELAEFLDLDFTEEHEKRVNALVVPGHTTTPKIDNWRRQ